MKAKVLGILVAATLALSLIVVMVGAVGQVRGASSASLTRQQFGVPLEGASSSGQRPDDNFAWSAFKKVCPFH